MMVVKIVNIVINKGLLEGHETKLIADTRSGRIITAWRVLCMILWKQCLIFNTVWVARR